MAVIHNLYGQTLVSQDMQYRASNPYAVYGFILQRYSVVLYVDKMCYQVIRSSFLLIIYHRLADLLGFDHVSRQRQELAVLRTENNFVGMLRILR